MPSICSVPNCINNVQNQNLCGKHYYRFIKYGDVNYKKSKIERTRFVKRTNCLIENCSEKIYKNKYCYSHSKIHKPYLEEQRKEYAKKFTSRFNKGLKSASKRNLVWDLTFEQYLNLLGNFNCYYCDYDIKESTGTNLDRKDSQKGYTFFNCVRCCGFCNTAKLDLYTFEEFVQISKTPAYKNARARGSKL